MYTAEFIWIYYILPTRKQEQNRDQLFQQIRDFVLTYET